MTLQINNESVTPPLFVNNPFKESALLLPVAIEDPEPLKNRVWVNVKVLDFLFPDKDSGAPRYVKAASYVYEVACHALIPENMIGLSEAHFEDCQSVLKKSNLLSITPFDPKSAQIIESVEFVITQVDANSSDLQSSPIILHRDDLKKILQSNSQTRSWESEIENLIGNLKM